LNYVVHITLVGHLFQVDATNAISFSCHMTHISDMSKKIRKRFEN